MSEYFNPGALDRDYTASELLKMAGNVAPWCALSTKPLEERMEMARTFGPNWASVMSGLGDQ